MRAVQRRLELDKARNLHIRTSESMDLALAVLAVANERVKVPGKMQGREEDRLFEQKPVEGVEKGEGKPNVESNAGKKFVRQSG
jgi:hypothetical protein